MKKRIFSLLLCFCMIFSLLPTVALADAGTAITPDYTWYTNAGESATEYQIADAADLLGFANIVNGTDGQEKESFRDKKVTLANDVDLGNISWTPIGSVKYRLRTKHETPLAWNVYYILGDDNTWTQVGSSGSDVSAALKKQVEDGTLDWTKAYQDYSGFMGEFDGNGKTIRNFTVDASSSNAGLFYTLQAESYVHDLTIDGVEATVGNKRFGTLTCNACGTAENVTVKNVKATTTDPSAWVGGMCAFMSWPAMKDCTVENLEVDAANGAAFVAGFSPILQKNDSYTFENLNVHGFKVQINATTKDGALVAGFVGQTQRGWEYPSIKNCNVTGIDITASGTASVAGFIAAPGAHTTIENCSTEGKIDGTGLTAESMVGGFFGDLGWNCDLGKQGHKVSNCTADVDITTSVAPAGGFIGSATNSNNNSMYAEFTGCTANGDVTATSTAPVGGFAGVADRGVYIDCAATGAVSGDGYVGGFFGELRDVTPKYDGRFPENTRDYGVDQVTLQECTGSADLTGDPDKTAGLIGFIADGTDLTLRGNNYTGKEYNDSGESSTAQIKRSAASVTDPDGVTTYYEDFTDALTAAESGDTIKLLENVRANVTIPAGKELTLDLNGRTLNGGTVANTPALTVNGVLTVKDSSEAKTGTIKREDTAENSGKGSHYVIDIQGENASLIFEGGNVTNNSGNEDRSKGASLVRVGDDSHPNAVPTLTIKGGTFTQDNFIAIKVDYGTLNVTGGEIGSANSYAIENWKEANISGGTINGAVASWTYSDGDNSTTTISGGTINGDVTAVNYGSTTEKKATVIITGGTFDGMLDTRSYDPTTGELTSITDSAKADIIVSGGTFTVDPTDYLEEGYVAKKLGEQTWGVSKKEPDPDPKPDPEPDLPVVIPVLPAIIGGGSNSGKLPFTDVWSGDWYYDSVRYVYDNDLMNGTSSTQFSPNAATTRGMIVTILARMDGVNTSGTPWYAAGREWAMRNGISDGTNMEGKITREQLAAMLSRYAALKGLDVSAIASISSYADASSVSSWATDAMRWSVGEGLIQGSNNYLRPQSNATRAEVATILMRFCELLEK